MKWKDDLPFNVFFQQFFSHFESMGGSNEIDR